MEKEIRRKSEVYLLVAAFIAILLGAMCYHLGVQPSPHDFRWVALAQQVGEGVFKCDLKELEVLEADAPQYGIPLDLNNVVNIKKVSSAFRLDEQASQLLKENGFVVVMWSRYDQFDEVYYWIDVLGIPIFVSSDSVLHVYHVFFDQILRRVEENYFIQNLTDTVERLVEESTSLYNETSDEYAVLKEAFKRNVCFFCVAAKLLNPDFEAPDFAEDLMNEELSLIEAHDGMYPSPIFCYVEDYSQYVPRGHYTRSEPLKRYFKAVMWLGRMRFMVRKTDDPELAKIQTVQAVLVAFTLNRVTQAKTMWEKMYAATAFFVGFPDDLTIYDYKTAVNEVFGENFTLTDLEDKKNRLEELQNKLMEMNHARIISSPIYPWQKDELAGLRFLGQKFIPDSYMFQELVFDKVAYRLMPKGLDVMAVLDSERAEEHLSSDKATYPDYEEQLNKLKSEFSELTVANWTQNLYWSWLYSIKSTLHETPEGYPTFMTTDAWLDEKLNTALGSWTELRHDTLLYAKQSYTVLGIPPVPPPGYVEPLPKLYSRLIGLCNMTLNGLSNLNLLDDDCEERLLEFRNLLTTIREISIQELKGEKLTETQIKFIRNIGDSFRHILEIFTKDAQKSTLVADVHTDPNTNRVLEDGCGYIDIIIAVYKSPNGTLIATAGPVFSYYEFTQPLSQRLTDEAWIEMLETGKVPPRPDWTSSFHPAD